VTNPAALPSSHHLSWLLVLPPQRLDPDGQQWLAHLCKDPLMAQCYTLLQDFRQLLHTRAVTDLDAWLTRADVSPLPQLRSFAQGLREDYDSVHAALAYPWSNGQTEGQVNRLKFIKRQMYGRASFALLRQKVLYQPGST
jgi:transposase